MMQYVRSDPSRYNVTVEKVEQFERLLVCLDQTIKCFRAVSSLTSRCFVTGMLQKTGKKKTGVTATEVADVQAAAGVESRIDIRTNRVFLEEIAEALCDHCTRVLQIEGRGVHVRLEEPNPGRVVVALATTGGLLVVLILLIVESASGSQQ
ncbi:hypothetical protein DVH05_006680 [Phytophthora capsici]|nr:hypothetical protein DVH05_006680 [Phytophthora capsici]